MATFLAVSSVATAQGGLHLRTASYVPSFGLLRDTVFILDTAYLEIRLDQQKILYHFRNGRVESYLCSTGTPSIEDGIATRQGIFTIQSKAKKTMSQEFQVYLNYWMGFDGGIGLHGLDHRSYYRYLGRRASSHGCVRISNETGAQLFNKVSMGTVVYVHSGSPARIIAFGDSAMSGLEPIYDIDKGVLKRRLSAVAIGRWDDSSLGARLVIPARRRLHERIDVGSVNPKLVAQYRIPVLSIPVKPVRQVFAVRLQRAIACKPINFEDL
ncbi:MAG TPA: L,D-transpeptidase [Candidatus Kapabacteria bacterium]|nr:L,D-transpeptidase [Candidatus Kapabacteria bacterium]